MSRVKLLSVHVFLAVAFLVMLLYARCAGELQPLFLIPAALLGVCALCYLWKRVVETSLLSYAAHASTLGFVWTLYWLYREDFIPQLPPTTADWASVALYVCLAFCTLLLVQRLCRNVRPTRKWGAALLALYPVSIIVIAPAVEDTAEQELPGFHFSSVVQKIDFKEISLPYETYRYHTSTRTVSIPDLKLQSIFLSVDKARLNSLVGSNRLSDDDRGPIELPMPVSAVLEVIDKAGYIRYAVPRTVRFDGTPLESEKSNERIAKGDSAPSAIEDSGRNFIDGQLVIISNGSEPYNWDVFYLLPSASQTLDDQSGE